MNPLVRLLVVLALALGGIYYGATAYQKLKTEDLHKLDLARVQREYLERANWVNAVPDVDHYRDERASLDKWFFTELTDHYNRFPAFKGYYRVQDEIAKERKKGGKNEADAALRAQYFALTKSVFDALKDGSYNPLFTGTSSSLRLDIYKIGRVTDGGKPRLRFDLVLWGAQRKMERETSAAGGSTSKMVVAASFQSLNFKLIDDKDKVFGEMSATGDPEIKVDYPERWIEEFPPQAVIGYYQLDPLPAQPVKMQLEIGLASRSGTGNDIPGDFKFEIPIQPEWKLAPGETWEGATTEERPKDYIEQKSAGN